MATHFPKILELQHLGFRSTLPAPALLPWVQNYWAIAQNHIPREGFAEKIYPDGGSTLYFRFHASAGEQQVNGVLAQALTSGTLSSRHEVFGVRFLPGGAFHLLGLPPVAAGTPPLDQVDLGLPELTTLHERLAQAQPEARPALMDQWLLQRAAKLDVHAGLIQHLWPQLLAADDLATLYEPVGISRRTFERMFDHEVGLSPGQLRQLQRIRRARYLIKTSPTASLTDIAYACGYFDQAHFNRHFRAMVNETPGQYRQRQLQRLRKGELVLA
jgi:AraC-like DNA-binding protein